MTGIFALILDRKFQVLLPTLVAVLFAPIAFGASTTETALVVNALLFLSISLWLITLISERRRPKLSKWLVGGGLFLVVLGLAHLANPKFAFDPESWSLFPQDAAVSHLPGTVDVCASGPAVLHALALNGGLFVVTDLCRDRRVRWWLLTTIALSGFFTAMLGIYQKAANVDAMLWTTAEQSGHLFFGMFRYHANAASFLNLCWPAALALWLRDCHRPGREVSRSFWLVVVVFTFLAVFVNSSKGGQLIGAALFVVVVTRYRKQIFWKERNWRAASVSMAAVIGVAAISILPGAVTNWSQWSDALRAGEGITGRWFVYQACFGAVSESGFWGMGPGTFRLIFPFYTSGFNMEASGIWIHAHQDFLQAVIEWGWIGAMTILLLVVAGLKRGLREIRFAADHHKLDLSISCGMIAFVGVLAHSLIDFPFQIPAVQLPALFYLAMLWRDSSKERRSLRKQKNAHMHHAGVQVEERELESA